MTYRERAQALGEMIGEVLASVPPTDYKPDPLAVGAPITTGGGAHQLHITLTDPTLKRHFRVWAADRDLSMNKAVAMLVTAVVDGKLPSLAEEWLAQDLDLLARELDRPADQ